MRIEKFNNTNAINFKSTCQKTLKATAIGIMPPINKHFEQGRDIFEKSFATKEKELQKILQKKNLISNGLASEFAKYEGDDYKFAKIITKSLKVKDTGYEVDLDKKALEQIGALNIECPILKSLKKAIKPNC